jgi:periplasmic copper chaperone A
MRWRMLWIPLAALLALPATAQAHVELTPDSVEAGGDALITIKSPNEAKVPLTGLRMTIPEDLVVEGAAAAPGFTLQVVRDQAGRVATLSWQGGSLPPEGLALFQFAATAPDSTGPVEMTATQTFADGSTKQWTTPVLEVTSSSADSSDTLARVLGGLAMVLAIAAIGAVVVLMGRRSSS